MAAKQNAKNQVNRLEDYRPCPYTITHADLTFRLDARDTRVTSTIRVVRGKDTEPGTPLVLDGDGLALVSVVLGGKPLAPDIYEASADELVLHKPPRSREFELTIVTRLAPEDNTALMGLYRSGGNFCTQCEAEGFRRITYFLDRPDVLAVYSVRLEARRDEAAVLLANGNPGASGDLGDGWHFAEWHDPWPKPSYLFAIVAGNLGVLTDRFTTMSGRKVDLAIYVEPGKEERAHYAMDALKRSMRWDEERFGCEYDLDVFNIVAVSDFNMGAMENKGLNIFNDKYVLADPDTATDTDYAGIEAVIAHEYFHNWTGNRITCRDWFQLCLKEGLTVYRDHEFSADQRSRPVKRIAEVKGLKAHQFPEDAGPLAHPVRPRRYREINNFYTATVYQKGSEVVRMIRTILGDEAFRKGMDLYLKRHDGEAATVEDFLHAFEDASGEDLSQFALWYSQAGTPHLNVSFDYDKPKREFSITVEQLLAPTPGESRKRLMHIPLAYALLGENGGEIDVQPEGGEAGDGILHIRKRRQEFRFRNVPNRPVVSLLRGFSAPVTLSASQSRDDLFFLARHDEDLYSRWQALNTLLIDALTGAAREIRGGKAAEFSAGLAEIMCEIAGNEALEAAFRAQALTLPSESDLAREIGQNIDPDSIFEACQAFTAWAGAACRTVFGGHYEALDARGTFSPDADQAGRRALRNVLLGYLSAADGDAGLAAAHYAGAGNMTDRIAALTVLAHLFPDSAETAAALDAFEARHGADPLVFDKWFTVQATIPGPDTLDRVKALASHPGYSPGNPNRVRALIGAFANANQTGFNRKDGAAYAYFADIILATDAKNPQIAARLLTSLRSWRSLEQDRRELARSALATIRSAPKLSSDVAEIVNRILA
ncbi:MAG: aminopeptidase N [Brucellaceae bacterium]|nr:aminopeptidase N [Brucellaceae bacterium]